MRRALPFAIACRAQGEPELHRSKIAIAVKLCEPHRPSQQWLAFIVVALAIAFAVDPAEAQESAPIWIAEPSSKPFRLSSKARIRYERVRQGDFVNAANALTFRLKTAFEIDLRKDTSILAEFEGGFSATDEFNDLIGSIEPFPVVADADFAELNRLQLYTEVIPHVQLTVGRQEITLDDERFVGAVAFRQDGQTYDGVRATVRFPGQLTTNLIYINQVNRIFPTRSDFGRFEGNSFIVNSSLTTPVGSLTGFHLALDLENPPAIAGTDDPFSSLTTGLRLEGGIGNGDRRMQYSASYAWQREFSGNLTPYSAHYWLGTATSHWGRLSVGGRVEVLSADETANASFQTPLGTNHAFQGTADLFLITPVDGIRDVSAQIGLRIGEVGPLRGVRTFARYHWFDAETDGRRYGEEIDAGVSGRLNGLGLSVELARYRAENFAVDTNRWWFTIQRSF